MKNDNPPESKSDLALNKLDFPLPVLSQTTPLDDSEESALKAYQRMQGLALKISSVSSYGVSESGGKPCLKIMLNSQLSETELKLLKETVENVPVVFSRGSVRFLSNEEPEPGSLLQKGHREL